VQLPQPYDVEGLLGFLRTRAVPGVEVVTSHEYRRANLSLRFSRDSVDVSDRRAAQALLDLDADVDGIDSRLGADRVLGPHVVRGLRVPGTVDAGELALRAVLGQQVSVAAARTAAGRLAQQYGARVANGPLDGGATSISRAFPTPAALAAIDPGTLPMPRARGRAFVGLAAALADGLDLADREALLALPGIGPWTADYVALRTSADRDVFLPTDLGVRHALKRLGLTAADAQRWRPFRSYAVIALWGTLGPSSAA
jgi:AraC family transcriptional regulator of adaptative response / DNA-3-methyladenine glycosylase II